MPPTLKTIAATWLSPGHPGPLRFHMGCRQHSLLAIKIAEDKRQTASTSWQILICKQAFLLFFFVAVFPLKRDFIGEKLNRIRYFEVNCRNTYLTLLWRFSKLIDKSGVETYSHWPGTFCFGDLDFSVFETLKLLYFSSNSFGCVPCHIP